MPSERAAPVRTVRTERADQIVAAARSLLEVEGAEALTMRRLAEHLGIKAPSLYKHLPDKRSLETAIIEEALSELGLALHEAVSRPGRRTPVVAVLATYRRYGVDNPRVYRLVSGDLPREALPAGLEEWAGSPFFLATRDAHIAQALWAFAHGMVILEIDDRFSDSSDLDRAWRSGAKAFSTQV